MREVTQGFLGAYTTLRLGGPARRLVEVDNADEAVEAVRSADQAGDPVLVLAGGSNVVIGDDGFDGTVVLLRAGSAGIGLGRAPDGERVALTVPAGFGWDELVSACVASGWSGIECLSGIPGLTGATPIQNVGAYGQEVAETIVSVEVYDRVTGERRTMSPSECGFGYRTSVFKGNDRWLVLAVSYVLRTGGRSGPIRYAELARALEVQVGERALVDDVRQAVLELRRRKGMVLDPADPDTYSVGSFFTNPVLDEGQFAGVRQRATELGGSGVGVEPPSWPAPDGRVKTSAAWLIERAGFAKGYRRGAVGISTKHTLALTNRDGGTTGELLELAREIRDGVRRAFDVDLHPEPVLVNAKL